VALTQIKPGINPRTEFDEGLLIELAQSLKDDGGSIQPLVVYYDDSDGMYGLIAGERRWRASSIAGLETVEIVVRPKPSSAAVARKLALKENMQREDLTPMEIARAVHEMLAEQDELGMPIYTKARLAEEIGKDASFITRCEAVLKCSQRVQLRVHQRKTPLEIAAMIGAQSQDMHEWLETEIVYREKPMTVVEAREFISEEVRRDLNNGQFSQDDDKLVPGKPACHACEFWGGNRADVVGKAKTRTCLNPACFDLKQRAHVTQAVSHSDDGDGVPMLSQDVAAKIFSFDGVTIKGDSGYVAADEMPDKILLVDPKAKTDKWGAMLQESGLECRKIVDGKGRVRTLYDARLALQAVTGPESAVRALFKTSGALKGVTPMVKTVDEAQAAKDKAKATGILVAGQSWVTKICECAEPTCKHDWIARLIYERLTETADREWMAKVLGVKDVFAEAKSIASNLLDILGLALVARTLRLQGPGSVPGIAGELATLIGYDAKREARDIAALVAKAGTKEESLKPIEGSEYPEPPELESGNLDGANDEAPESTTPEPETQPKQRGGKREKNVEAEKIALSTYLDTGSIAKAAEACGLDVESVKNWHKRRGWKALREAHLAKAK
jgi:ParB/RepB/Spo0J family partition protein